MKRKSFSISVFKLLIVIFVLFVSFGAIFYIGNQPVYTSNDLFEEYYIPQPYETIPLRGGCDRSFLKDQQLAEAIQFYQEENYENALEIFKSIYRDLGKDAVPEEIMFYAAICMIELNNEKEAIAILEDIANNPDSDFQQDALWSLTLAYLKADQRERAKEELYKMVSKQELYADDAGELLDKLNRKKWF